MALIRHTEAASLARDAMVLNLGDLQRQADELKSLAEAEAARIIEAAHEQRRLILQGAREEGYEAGYKDGHEQGTETGQREGRDEKLAEYAGRLENVASSFEGALGQFERARDSIVLHAKDDGLRLILEIAERVTRRAVALDRSTLELRIGEAISRVLDPSSLVVRVHPDDMESAREVLGSFVGRVDSSSHASVVEDGSLAPGDARITAGRGRVDATLDAMLGRVMRELMPDAPAAGPEPEGDGGAAP